MGCKRKKCIRICLAREGALPRGGISKTSEAATVLGYPCTKYVVESTLNDRPVKQVFWTTTAIRNFDLTPLTQQRLGSSGQAFYYEQIEGVPLKIEMTHPEGRMIFEAMEVKKEALPSSDFAIPAGFTEVEFSLKR